VLLAPGAKDPLYSILRSKREVSRLQILVENRRTPAGCAAAGDCREDGCYPQAISEYIRELIEEGMVLGSDGENYEVQGGSEGCWPNRRALESYARHIRRDIIQGFGLDRDRGGGSHAGDGEWVAI